MLLSANYIDTGWQRNVTLNFACAHDDEFKRNRLSLTQHISFRQQYIRHRERIFQRLKNFLYIWHIYKYDSVCSIDKRRVICEN